MKLRFTSKLQKYVEKQMKSESNHWLLDIDKYIENESNQQSDESSSLEFNLDDLK